MAKLFAICSGVVGAGLVLYKSNDNNRVLRAAHQPLESTTKWDWNWDRREPAFLVRPSDGGEDDARFNKEVHEKKPSATRHIFLIRHGEFKTEMKSDRERVLTEKGIEQAKLTGDRLVALNFPYQSMIRSTLTRAQQTGDYILTRMPPGSLAVMNDKLLEEGYPCRVEPQHSSSWRPDVEIFRTGSRIEAAFRNYFYRADYRQKEDSFEIIVCHANVIRYFVCRALQLPPEAWLRLSLNHASITWLSIRPDGLIGIQSLGDSGHLPPELITCNRSRQLAK